MSVCLPHIPDIDQMMRITARLTAARSEEPRLAGAEPGDLIRHVSGKRAIFHGQLEGRAVVFRLHLAPEDGAAQREWEEMQRLWPYMAVGDLRIPQPICAAPAMGVVVQEYVPGTPMLELLYSLDAGRRAAYLPPAAAWLRAGTAMTEGWRASRCDSWIARAARATAQQPFAQLRTLEQAILVQMERLAPHIASEPWRVAICHGDYHPNNLIVDGSRLTGIDLGGSQRLPLMKDIARFAMHMGRRRLRLSDRTVLGVDRTCLMAFADAFELSEVERAATLIRVENTRLPPARIDRAEKTYRDLLQGLGRCEPGVALI
jgi:hypothetical protein